MLGGARRWEHANTNIKRVYRLRCVVEINMNQRSNSSSKPREAAVDESGRAATVCPRLERCVEGLTKRVAKATATNMLVENNQRTRAGLSPGGAAAQRGVRAVESVCARADVEVRVRLSSVWVRATPTAPAALWGPQKPT